MRRITLAATLALVTFGVSAQPVKCVDASGRIRYIDASMAGQEKCKPVQAETNTVAFQSGAGIPSSGQPGTRSLTEREAALKRAQDTLAEAQKKLAEQEAIRTGGERNYARVEERLKPFQDAVQAAEKSVEQAQRNLR